ncbi:MAG: Hsp20/alpha crystallin family protein [FCB group bacterium]|nr:Hsp20/alpha crystallin family protein [FCB group bacterium]
MSLVKWQPMRSLISPVDEWNRFLTDFFGDMLEDSYVGRTWVPAVDIQEDNDNYIVHADLPGMSKKDIHINVKDNILSIEGERKYEHEDKKDNFHRIERSYGTFKRSFRLPEEVRADKITAKFKDGVLTINLPKAEEVKSKAIEIKVA